MNYKMNFLKNNFKQLNWRIIKKGFAYFVAIISISAILVVFDLGLNGRVMPGTSFSKLDLSLQNSVKSNPKINAVVKNYLETPLTFTLEQKTIKIPLKELGISFSPEHLACP